MLRDGRSVNALEFEVCLYSNNMLAFQPCHHELRLLFCGISTELAQNYNSLSTKNSRGLKFRGKIV